jgi:hypothetical protein
MYIRILNFQTDGNKKAEAIAIMDNLMPKIKAQRGCRDCLFIMHESDDRYALLVFWESREDADNAAPIIGPQMIPALNKISKEAVVPRLYEVYQSETVVA